MRSKIFFAILSLFLLVQFLNAQVPQLLNYQGKLINKDGLPASGNFTMNFSIYSTESGGMPLWTEKLDTVKVFRGVFNVLLNIPTTIFTESGDRFLGIRIGNEPEMTPRFQLISVAYAVRSKQADGVADNAITSKNIVASQVVKSINLLKDDVTLAAGMNVSLTKSGNTLTIAAPNADISGVNAGPGLSGGGTTGNVTLSLDNSYTDARYVNENQYNSVTSSMIVNNSITGFDISSDSYLIISGLNTHYSDYYDSHQKLCAYMGTNTYGYGLLAAIDPNGVSQAGAYIGIYNNEYRGYIFGDQKSFRMPNPENQNTEIWYTCPEGPEAAAYIRGTGKLFNGRGTVAFPSHFSIVANSEGMTVNLTPLSETSKGLAVIEKNNRGIIVVELNSGSGSYDFDYMVMAVRKGYESYEVIREVDKIQAELANPAVTTEESIEQRKEK